MVLEVLVSGRTRLAVNTGIDWLLILTGLPLAVSSLLLWVVFPRGFYAHRLLWREIHLWSGLAFGVLSALHLALHLPQLWRCTKALVLPSSRRGPRDSTCSPTGL